LCLDLFALRVLILAGLADFVRLVFTDIDADFLAFVRFNVVAAFTLVGAEHVDALATTRPLRLPVVQRYLRVVLFPLLANVGTAPSINCLKNIIVSYSLIALCDLQRLFF